jgi:Holliday junction resolvasome RuvABC ATP-dependent DNA helicase subunit
VKCTACGTDLRNPQQYCTKCGARLIARPASPHSIQTKDPAPRITRFSQIIEQKNAVSRLTSVCEFFRSKNAASDHILLVGPDGSGRRAIAQAFAGEMAVSIKELDAANLEKVGDLTLVMTALESRDIMLIQNIGSMPSGMRQLFLNALHEYRIYIVIGQGVGRRTHPYQLNPFTCIATARRESDCPTELREAFSLTVSLESYSQSELETLAIRIAADVAIEPAAARLIASACAGSPHQLETLIKRLARLSPALITSADTRELLSTLGLRISEESNSGTDTKLQQLTGTQFEEVITSLLTRLGFRTQMTKASGDGGIDIVAVSDRPFVGGKYLIQCKRFSEDTPVGSPTVREFYGAVSADRGAVKGILVTTSSFSANAKDFAQSVGIELIDMDQLRSLLAEAGMETLGLVPPKANLL